MTWRARTLRILAAALLMLPLTRSSSEAPRRRRRRLRRTTPDRFERSDAPTVDSIEYDPSAGVVDILQVSGLLDPLLADFIIDGITDADADRVRAVILQVNSTGSVISDDELAEVATAIRDARIPVTMWVGPSNARALGPWVELAALTDRFGIAPGARIGDRGDARLDESFGADWGPAGRLLVNDTIGPDMPSSSGSPPSMHRRWASSSSGLEDLGVELAVVGSVEDARTVAVTTPRFQRLSLLAGQLHTVASPPVAYLLFTIGLALLVFEFYTAGVASPAWSAPACSCSARSDCGSCRSTCTP